MVNRHCSRLSPYFPKLSNNPRWVQSHYSIELFKNSWLCAIWLKYMLTCNAWIIALFMDTYIACNSLHSYIVFWIMSLKERKMIWYDDMNYKSMMIQCTKFMYLWLMYATEMILRCISMFSKRMSCHPPLREVIIGGSI